MGTFFRKDLLVYWRDRKEVLISLFLPLVLIIVLELALPDWIESSSEPIRATAALVIEDDEHHGVAQFRTTLAENTTLDEDVKQVLLQQAERISPIAMFRGMLLDEQVAQVVEVVEYDRDAASRAVQEQSVSAVITIPEGYTAAVLNRMLLSDGDGGTLMVTAEKSDTTVDIIHGIVAGFAHHINFQTALEQAMFRNAGELDRMGSSPPGFVETYTEVVGGLESIPGVRKITAYQYYASAIGILFALFVAMTSATKAMTEKREQVLSRIMMSGARPIHYLLGKAGSTFILSLLQLLIVFLFTNAVLRAFPDRSWSFWLGMLFLFFVVALCVASFTLFFTTLVFRLKDETANSIMLIGLVVFGTIGGGFVPLYILPEWLQLAGVWTPNGLALTAVIRWLQTENVVELVTPTVTLLCMTAVIGAVSASSFPKRGQMG